MSQEEAIKYWLNAAERDRRTAQDMFKLGHYNWSLFLWHLVIERMIKALIIKRNRKLLLTHDLIRLAEVAGLNLSESHKGILREITTFNIESRYDDYKEQFYKKATKEYSLEWSDKAEEIYKWLKTQL